MNHILPIFTIAALVVACASPEEAARSDGRSVDAEKLLDGEFSFSHRAVGKLELSGMLCTATLIRPDVILTAAHCVEYRDRDRPGRRLGTFTIEHDRRTAFSFDVEATAHFATVEGKADPGDVAIARLATPVADDIARPADLARRLPTRGFWASIVGYGCANDSRQRDEAVGHKQVYRFKFDPDDVFHAVCPGDSGGPTLDQAGRVFRVTSGWDRSGDVFGDVIGLTAEIEAGVDAWTVDSAPAAPDTAAMPEPAPPASTRGPVIHRAAFEADSGGGVLDLAWSPLSGVPQYDVRLTSFTLDGQEVAVIQKTEAGAVDADGLLTALYFGLDVCEGIYRQSGRWSGDFNVRVDIAPAGGIATTAWLTPKLTCLE